MNDYGEDDNNPDGRRSEEPWMEEARARVQTPGTILLVFGLISLFLAPLSMGIYAFSPETVVKPLYDMMVDMQKGQPPNQQQALPPYEQYVKDQQFQNLISGAFSFLCSVFIVLGGMKMKSLTGYGWGMAGSILAIIPVCTNSCCCLSTPFGIWALVVLLNSDVKLAFARVAARGISE